MARKKNKYKVYLELNTKGLYAVKCLYVACMRILRDAKRGNNKDE